MREVPLEVLDVILAHLSLRLAHLLIHGGHAWDLRIECYGLLVARVLAAVSSLPLDLLLDWWLSDSVSLFEARLMLG